MLRLAEPRQQAGAFEQGLGPWIAVRIEGMTKPGHEVAAPRASFDHIARAWQRGRFVEQRLDAIAGATVTWPAQRCQGGRDASKQACVRRRGDARRKARSVELVIGDEHQRQIERRGGCFASCAGARRQQLGDGGLTPQARRHQKLCQAADQPPRQLQLDARRARKSLGRRLRQGRQTEH